MLFDGDYPGLVVAITFFVVLIASLVVPIIWAAKRTKRAVDEAAAILGLASCDVETLNGWQVTTAYTGEVNGIQALIVIGRRLVTSGAGPVPLSGAVVLAKAPVEPELPFEVRRVGGNIRRTDSHPDPAFNRRCAITGAAPDRVVTRLLAGGVSDVVRQFLICLLYTSPSPRDGATSRMPSSA